MKFRPFAAGKYIKNGLIINGEWRLKNGSNRRNTQIKEKAEGNC
jgi:hypothetical protein